jgi:hypothetical protein
MKIITTHSVIGADNFYSDEDKKFVSYLEVDVELEFHVSQLRRKFDIPANGFNLNKPLNKNGVAEWWPKIDQRMFDKELETLISVWYDLPTRWVPTFQGIVMCNLAFPPVPKFLVNKKGSVVTIYIDEYTTKKELKKFIEEDKTISSKLRSLPKYTHIHGSFANINRRKKLVLSKGNSYKDIAQENSIGGDTPEINAYIAVSRAYRQLHKSVFGRGMSVIPMPEKEL